MGFYLSQPKKSPWQTSSTRNSKSQEFCFIPQLNIFAAWTISEVTSQILVPFLELFGSQRPDSLVRSLASAAMF